jgi:hypothetical protein
MLDCGHETPVRNNSGTETNTMSNMTFSRYFTIHDTTMPKKMQASVYGIINASKVVHSASCGKWNRRGTAATSQVPITP